MSVRSKNDLISLEIVTFFKPLVAEGQILAKKPKKAIDLFIAFCLEKKWKLGCNFTPLFWTTLIFSEPRTEPCILFGTCAYGARVFVFLALTISFYLISNEFIWLFVVHRITENPWMSSLHYRCTARWLGCCWEDTLVVVLKHGLRVLAVYCLVIRHLPLKFKALLFDDAAN